MAFVKPDLNSLPVFAKINGAKVDDRFVTVFILQLCRKEASNIMFQSKANEDL